MFRTGKVLRTSDLQDGLNFGREPLPIGIAVRILIETSIPFDQAAASCDSGAQPAWIDPCCRSLAKRQGMKSMAVSRVIPAGCGYAES